MSSLESQKDAASPTKERPAEPVGENSQIPTSAEDSVSHTVKDRHCDGEYIIVNTWDASSPSKKRRRSQSSDVERDLHVDGASVASEKQQLECGEKTEENGEAPKENGHVEDEKEGEKLTETAEAISNGTTKEADENEDQQEQKAETLSDEVQINRNSVEELEQTAYSEAEDARKVPARVPSPAVHVSGIDMVFPEDEVPIELCMFSSDGSVEATLPESSPRRLNSASEAATPTTPSVASTTPVGTASMTPASVTTENSITPNSVHRTMGKRKRRKRLSYSAPRSKTATKEKQEQTVPASPALEGKLSISVNGHAAVNGDGVGCDGTAPPSPVYPDADASYLYPSTPEGAPWRWEDVDPYFDPLTQSDLDNLVRWRKENADFIAANPKLWHDVPELENKRAVLETMLADASDASTSYVEFPVRRGRNYRDVWEELDFLDHHKRDTSMEENHAKSQVVKMKMKRKSAANAKSSLLFSHRDLVYGYDDDLYQKFRSCLESKVKACQSDSPPATPPTPPTRRQQGGAKVDENSADTTVHEIVFDKEVLPLFPVHHLHPASLGLWKLRKKQEPDFSVVHPASVKRAQVPARWKEEMKRHHQQQYELQLQQTDELADPSDGDDEGTGDNTRDRFRATISNSEITSGLPSFGTCVEEDEISQALNASMRKLVPLSIYNWRTAQLVNERAACSIQCAPILEGEASAARELEDVFLQLCPPDDSFVDTTEPPGSGPTRQPRASQINSVPHDMIAYSVRHDIADNCSLAVAASVEFALGLSMGDVVDVLDRNGCWNYGEVVETYSEDRLGTTKFLLLRFSLWSEDTVEWIAASEGRILPQGVANGSRPCSVGPTRGHRVRVRYDQSLARMLERSFPQRQAKQAVAASGMLAQRQHNIVIRSSSDYQKTPQKRKRKRPAKSTPETTAT